MAGRITRLKKAQLNLRGVAQVLYAIALPPPRNCRTWEEVARRLRRDPYLRATERFETERSNRGRIRRQRNLHPGNAGSGELPERACPALARSAVRAASRKRSYDQSAPSPELGIGRHHGLGCFRFCSLGPPCLAPTEPRAAEVRSRRLGYEGARNET